MEKRKQVAIKISGEKTAVTSTLEKIERLFPIAVVSSFRDNDNGDGVHVFLTVPAEEA
ncbi:MAG: hypothetical protein M1490_04660 [Candidatus Bathyarchaeota archaeon]|nr:hypothetical protein [Candidatus Bathyarchaeota archaeon]